MEWSFFVLKKSTIQSVEFPENSWQGWADGFQTLGELENTINAPDDIQAVREILQGREEPS